MAKAISVSEVEVSLSTVMQLNERSTDLASIACSAGAAIAASVKTKASMVAISGAIMPAPLAMPLMTTSASPILTRAVATLGKVSVVMIARAASIRPSGLALAASSPRTAAILPPSSGSPITPVEAMNICSRLRPRRLARRLGDMGDGARADSAGEGVGVARIDDDRPRMALARDFAGTSRPAPTGIWSG